MHLTSGVCLTSEAKGDKMESTGSMRYYVVSNAESAEYTVKYGLPGEISLPVATTVSRGIAERIAKAMNKSEASTKAQRYQWQR